MAQLEFIDYTPWREEIDGDALQFVPDKLGRPIKGLPTIFWSNGEPWSEANHFSIEKVLSNQGQSTKTALALMKHLAAYANWLESEGLDWRHFPVRRDDRSVVRFRGYLIDQRDRTGGLSPGTTTARMAAVIQFYRHVQAYGLIAKSSPLWKDRMTVIRYHDSVGFERAIMRLSSELAIPNRKRNGLHLEDGLTPLRTEDVAKLMKFTQEQNLRELHLMLSLGILAGARIDTITSLGVKNIETAYPDVQTPGTYRLRVGPGTGVRTKFDVSGELMVPKFLIDNLKEYSYSMQRLRRQDLASEPNRGLLFLTSRGNPYVSSTFNRLMTDLRRNAVADGLRFMHSFKFHQTRATFGTWLMGVAISVAGPKVAVEFVKQTMLHRHERTTFLYVRFLEEAPIKAQMAKEFSQAFSGLLKRDWTQYHA
ncbi:tyrosine-type recombinase/integrase [Noviherbaspirillum galbum]|uniref:Site-specific integrase n=1 Tax=Noviherbaspirillum galbum TaxID=2709383 RepID=A0A6B3SVN0_9BURK|nr:tyrosine-type recombinase/integrase [Noviherbaspirillum galbum]NEX63445.1 site-specific integrase [Noviherbaspirillum galbum]